MMKLRDIGCLLPFLAILAGLSALPARADDAPVRFALGHIPYVLHPTETGRYNIIFDRLVEGVPHPIEVTYFPIKRALQRMIDGSHQCFALAIKDSPNLEAMGIDTSDLQFIGPFSTVRLRAFVKKDAASDGLDGLSGQFIAADASVVNIRQYLGPEWDATRIVGFDSFMDALAQVENGRARAALIYDLDAGSISDDHPFHGQFVPVGPAFNEIEDGIECRTDPVVKPVINHMQARLDDMARSGELEEIMRSR